jgi:hypothetical protein
MTTPIEQDIPGKCDHLREAWADAGRTGDPQVHVLVATRPGPDDLGQWADAGATDVIWGLPDQAETDVLAYLDKLAARVVDAG